MLLKFCTPEKLSCASSNVYDHQGLKKNSFIIPFMFEQFINHIYQKLGLKNDGEKCQTHEILHCLPSTNIQFTDSEVKQLESIRLEMLKSVFVLQSTTTNSEILQMAADELLTVAALMGFDCRLHIILTLHTLHKKMINSRAVVINGCTK